MKILLASSSSGSRGGGELYLLYLGRALADRGHELILWASSHPRMDELAAAFAQFGQVARAEYTNTYDLPGRSVASWLKTGSARRAAADWEALAPDVIHLNKQNLEDGLDLLRAAQMGDRPSVCTIHLTQSARYLKARIAFLRDAISRGALIAYKSPLVVIAQSRVRDLAEFVGESTRIHVVPNGVLIPDAAALAPTREAARQELAVAPEELLCLAVGRMVAQKRPFLFLETAAQIHQRIPHARFRWIGDGPLTVEWDAWVAAKGLGKVIQRLPWQRDVPRLLGAADLFLHVAEYEGLAFAILEALAAGLPCAITANLLAEMPFLNGQNSIAISDEAPWIAKLEDLAGLRETGRAARVLAEDQFSYSRMAANYEALYRSAIAAE